MAAAAVHVRLLLIFRRHLNCGRSQLYRYTAATWTYNTGVDPKQRRRNGAKGSDKQDGAADDEGSVAGTAAVAQGSVAQAAASKITLLVYGDGQAVPHEFEVAGDSADFEADPNADLAGGAESAMTVATEWIESLQGAARYGMQRFRQARTPMTIGSTNIRERARTLELEHKQRQGQRRQGTRLLQLACK